jgi:DNA-binding NarL/FixJ family response regulator
MKKKIKVLVVDDQDMMREGIAAMLSYHEKIEVIGQAGDGVEALRQAKKQNPDVILLDLMMPELDGFETIPLLKEKNPDTHILVLTGSENPEYIYRAIKRGAIGYLLKDFSMETLFDAIVETYHGRAFIPATLTYNMIRGVDVFSSSNETNTSLTKRELETLKLIALGLSNQEISQKMVVEERTVAKYVSNILKKIHVDNRTQAALYALRLGLADLNHQD